MKRFSRIVLLGLMVGLLAVGGSALAAAKTHAHGQAHAKVADVFKDVQDFTKDSTDAGKDNAAARQDLSTPDSPAQAHQEQTDGQNEQVDNQGENQDGTQEGDNAAQAAACQGLGTDNVQYDDQTGTCTAETGQDNGADTQTGQDGNSSTTGQDNGTADSQDTSQNG